MAKKLAVAAILLSLLGGTARAQPFPEAGPGDTCEGLAHCLERLRAPETRVLFVNSTIDTVLHRFGDRAVDALVPMLADPQLSFRQRAGYVLSAFERIDPRHLPALVAAWKPAGAESMDREGNGWLPRAIAATGTDGALHVLWADYMRRSSHIDQVRFALAKFGDRLRPLVRGRLALCRTEWTEMCENIVQLFPELNRRWPRPPRAALPQWAVDELVGLLSASSEQARDVAVDRLALQLHLAALAPLQARLRAISPTTLTDREVEWRVRFLIGDISNYGTRARTSGTDITPYLASGHHHELRAEAALALGQIGATLAIPVLIGMSHDFADDWLIAYNVVESLGRLRAGPARGLLASIARDHWHRGVRNNALRALNMIDGGAFVRAGVEGDGLPFPVPRDGNGEEYIYSGHLRYAGDESSRRCEPPQRSEILTISQEPIGHLSWPRQGVASLNFTRPHPATATRLRARVSTRQVAGRVVATLAMPSGGLVAFDGGEFGGGLFHVPPEGDARPIVEANILAAWRMSGRLYLAAGSTHGVSNSGELYVVDSDRLALLRSIRLPAMPRRIGAAHGRAVVIDTAGGAIGVMEDGSLIAAETIDQCDDD